jgi:hypothetical protein
MITRSATGAIDPATIANRQEFATALTALREDAGLTVRQVARAAAINPSTAGGYFSGRHLPPLRPQGSIRSILAVCGITDPAEVAAWERSLARVRRPPGPRPAAIPAPYRGLARYTSHDAAWFFGRDDEVRRLNHQLDDARRDGGVVVVVGQAGSGKSSLLAAGLLPRLSSGLAVHPVATITPGADPLRALATALATLVNGDPVEVLADLLSTPNAVRDVARRTVPPLDRVIVLPGDEPAADRASRDRASGDTEQRPSPSPLPTDAVAAADPYPVIVVDQLEELFLQCRDVAAQHAFVAALAALSRPDRDGGSAVAVVVMAVRTEFLTEAARHPDLLKALQADGSGSVASLLPMSTGQLRSVILDPARKAGLDIEDGLVDQILADLATTPEPVLPRLSHALLTTWRAGQRSRLTQRDYRETGGTRRALTTSAEATFAALPDAARAAAPAVFQRAARVAARAVAARAEGPSSPAGPAGAASKAGAGAAPSADEGDLAASTAVEQAFIEAGLLTVDRNGLRLVSDVLISSWPRLHEWLLLVQPYKPSPPVANGRTVWQDPGDAATGGGVAPAEDAVRRMARWWAWRWAMVAALLLGAVLTGVWMLR